MIKHELQETERNDVGDTIVKKGDLYTIEIDKSMLYFYHKHSKYDHQLYYRTK